MFKGGDVVRRLLQPCRDLPGNSQRGDRCPQRDSPSDSRIVPASVSSGRATGASQDQHGNRRNSDRDGSRIGQ
jgi:hypothetical protein